MCTKKYNNILRKISRRLEGSIRLQNRTWTCTVLWEKQCSSGFIHPGPSNRGISHTSALSQSSACGLMTVAYLIPLNLASLIMYFSPGSCSSWSQIFYHCILTIHFFKGTIPLLSQNVARSPCLRQNTSPLLTNEVIKCPWNKNQKHAT